MTTSLRFVEQLRSDWLTQGPAVDRFSRPSCASSPAPSTLSPSRTERQALHLACLAAGREARRTTASRATSRSSLRRTASATPEAKLHVVDVDPSTALISTSGLEAEV